MVRDNRRETRRIVLEANVQKGQQCSRRWRRKIRRKGRRRYYSANLWGAVNFEAKLKQFKKTQVYHFVVCLTTGPQPLAKRVLHTLRSNASAFSFQQPLFSLMSSTSCLRFLPCLPVTCFLLSIFPSITCFGRQFQLKMRPIQLAFLFIICIYLYSCKLPRLNTQCTQFQEWLL